MISEVLLSALRNEPFFPFKLRLVSGHAVPVDHPEFIAHTPGSGVAVVIKFDESLETIDLASVVSLEFQPPAEKR
jgi:hypothetical protein